MNRYSLTSHGIEYDKHGELVYLDEAQAALDAKDEEIKRLKEKWESRRTNLIEHYEGQHQILLTEARWAMEVLKAVFIVPGDDVGQRAQAFLEKYGEGRHG